MVRENVFWIQEQWFIYKAKPEKSLFSPYPYHICLSVGFNSKWFPAKECICCFSSCSFPYWQNTLQNVLLQPTSQCFICFLPPSLSLLKASSVPAHELHTMTVPLSKMCLQLEAGYVTSAGERCYPREEYRGHSSHNFFVPFSGRLDLLVFRGAFPPQLSRWTVICWGKTPMYWHWTKDCGSLADADPAYLLFSDFTVSLPCFALQFCFSCLCIEFVPS